MSEADILAALGRLEAGQERLEGALGQLRAVVMERIDRLQDSMTAIRDDIAVNFGTADAAQRANDNTRSELRSLAEILTGMQRQIQRLQTDVRTLKGEP